LSNSLATHIENIAIKTASKKGFEVVDVALNEKVSPMTIQVQIRPIKGGDVSLEDCALLSEPMSIAFDSSKVLNKNYVLEISSPGINECLESDRDFETFKGFPIEVIFRDKEKQESELKRIGLLQERSVDHLKLNLKGKMNTIPWKDIIKVRLTTPTG
tara:strand:+ start:640 stop:1113 length:474 start_codon:yes stop_codon:yes gene_type:complete